MRVTANQVTFARLIAIPFLAAFLYGGSTARLVALFLGIAVGFTDLLDGYLARKYGPTVLGGLMDPIADKVFVSATLLVLGDLGMVPWWLVHAVLVREFAVTALRSSFEKRQRSLRSTYLAKVKTWVQMFLLAVVVGLVEIPALAITVGFVVIAAAAVVAAVAAQVLRRRWPGIRIFAAFFVLGTTLHIVVGPHALLLALYIVVVGITWVSALDYIGLAVRELAGARDLHVFDTWRLLGAVAIPLLCGLCLSAVPVPPWAIVALVVSESFHGGLDNLLAHHDAAAGAWEWAGRTLTVAILLALALAMPAAAAPLALAALAASALPTVVAFVRHRRTYL